MEIMDLRGKEERYSWFCDSFGFGDICYDYGLFE